jgi:ActR/RegA family two-component response regulator
MGNESKPKILVVDDDERWLRRISIILQTDYDLTLTTDPLEALETLKEYSYALVILDMRLPEGRSGIEVFSQMQEISPNLRAVILTGYPDTGSMRSSFKKGFLDYLEKGASNLPDELRAAVKEAIADSIELDVLMLIARGESDDLEFKSSSRWDVRANRINKDLERVVIKTIAAFLNSEKGGVLLIGVDDNGNIVGLQADYNTLGKKNRDGYETYLTDLLLTAFGKDLSIFLKITFHQIEEKEICCVKVKPSTKAVFVNEDKNEHLYIRTGNSTRLLSTREAIEYCKLRWKG